MLEHRFCIFTEFGGGQREVSDECSTVGHGSRFELVHVNRAYHATSTRSVGFLIEGVPVLSYKIRYGTVWYGTVR